MGRGQTAFLGEEGVVGAIRRRRPQACCWVILGQASAGCPHQGGKDKGAKDRAGVTGGREACFSFPHLLALWTSKLPSLPASTHPSLPSFLLPFLSFNLKTFTEITLDVYSVYQSSLTCVL